MINYNIRQQNKNGQNKNIATGFATQHNPGGHTGPTGPKGPTVALPNDENGAGTVINGTLHNATDWQKPFGVDNKPNKRLGFNMKYLQASTSNNPNGLPLPSGLSEKAKKEQLRLDNTKLASIPASADDYIKANTDKSLQAITYSKAIYPVAGEFLENALQGDGKVKFYDKDSFVASKIANSQPLRDFMVKFKDKKEHEIKGLKGSMEFGSNSNNNNKDLYYAVGKCNFEITGVRENADGSKSITIVMSDDYDYDGYRDGSHLGSYLNNIGVIGQLRNQIKPYSWQAEVEYIYNKKFSDLDSKNEA